MMFVVSFFFFFKQKTAYELRISDWSSDVCSSDLTLRLPPAIVPSLLARAPRSLGSESPAGLRWATCGSLCLTTTPSPSVWHRQIGRASCRERVCQYV